MEKKATVVAFDLGTCGGHPAYQAVDWYFPSNGDKFNARDGWFTCGPGIADTDETDAGGVVGPWFTATELFPWANVTKTISGNCAQKSVLDPDDVYAWRCTTAGGAILDPCFAPGPDPVPHAPEVACYNGAYSEFGPDPITVIKLTRPLAESNWGRATSKDDATLIRHADHPWILQLANGDECAPVTGRAPTVDGVTLYYRCTYGESALPSQKTEPWTTKYVPTGSGTATSVQVAEADY